MKQDDDIFFSVYRNERGRRVRTTELVTECPVGARFLRSSDEQWTRSDYESLVAADSVRTIVTCQVRSDAIWPSVLHVGGCATGLVMREEDARQLRSEGGVECASLGRVVLRDGDGALLEDVPAYVHLVLPPGGLLEDDTGAVADQLTYMVEQSRVRGGSWSGAVLFADAGAPRAVCCTVAFVEIARRLRLDGIYFRPTDAPFMHGVRVDYLNHLVTCWPPKSWYPTAVD